MQLAAPTIVPESSVDQACDFVLARQGGEFQVVPVSAALIGTNPSPSDPTLYPSDHFGVIATYNIVRNAAAESGDDH